MVFSIAFSFAILISFKNNKFLNITPYNSQNLFTKIERFQLLFSLTYNLKR